MKSLDECFACKTKFYFRSADFHILVCDVTTAINGSHTIYLMQFSHLTSFLCNAVFLSRVAVVLSGISKEIKGDNKVISLYSSGMGLYESIRLKRCIFCGRYYRSHSYEEVSYKSGFGSIACESGGI